jgi:CBS domain-containing protein
MKDGELYGILSQSKVVRFFSRHMGEFDFGTLPISNLNLGIRFKKARLISYSIRKVQTIGGDSTVFDALKKIREAKVSGLGIVNDEGKLIGLFWFKYS